jgi:hypothetical protein
MRIRVAKTTAAAVTAGQFLRTISQMSNAVEKSDISEAVLESLL